MTCKEQSWCHRFSSWLQQISALCYQLQLSHKAQVWNAPYRWHPGCTHTINVTICLFQPYFHPEELSAAFHTLGHGKRCLYFFEGWLTRYDWKGRVLKVQCSTRIALVTGWGLLWKRSSNWPSIQSLVFRLKSPFFCDFHAAHTFSGTRKWSYSGCLFNLSHISI